ncbi:MAG: hypothetical protein GY820_39950 [Gammaproteobacteria bacterium]|nr:hypothetical protein [Gammaproteobacteria bacterium]
MDSSPRRGLSDICGGLLHGGGSTDPTLTASGHASLWWSPVGPPKCTNFFQRTLAESAWVRSGPLRVCRGLESAVFSVNVGPDRHTVNKEKSCVVAK